MFRHHFARSRARAVAKFRQHASFNPAMVEVLEERRLLTATASVLKDIAVDSSNPSNFLGLVDKVLFTATTDPNAGGLFISDGTKAGTTLLKSSVSGNLAEVNSTVFFANSALSQLWKTDGTVAGTQLVRSFTHLEDLTAVGNTLFMVADDGIHGRELWKSDGTNAGTVQVADLLSGDNTNQGPSSLTDAGGTLYFNDIDDDFNLNLWKSDGTAAGTVPVTNVSAQPVYDGNFASVNGAIYFTYFTNSKDNLAKVDQSTGSVQILASAFYVFGLPVAAGDQLFFLGPGATSGDALWTTDGTAANTHLVKEVVSPTTHRSSVANLFSIDDTIYFHGNDGSGDQLWKSDGTTAGSVPVTGVPSAALAGLTTGNLVDFNGESYFRTPRPGGINGDLWKTDGTGPGTVQVTSAPSIVGSLFSTGSSLFFSAGDDTHGYELWKSDGTTGGTVMAVELNFLSRGSSSPSGFIQVGDETLFFATGSVQGRQLWRTDGTTAGTVPIMNVSVGSFTSDATLNNELYFFANLPNSTSVGLWKSDGTAEGTVVVTPVSNAHDELYAFNGAIYFVTTDTHLPLTGQLWRTDGTAAGTVMIKNLGSINNSTSLTVQFTQAGGTMFLAFPNGSAAGSQLWRSDGTTAGTAQIAAVPQTRLLEQSVDVGGTLYYSALDSTNGWSLWKTDSAGAPPTKVTTVAPQVSATTPTKLINYNGELVFIGTGKALGFQLWRSDGTDAGTVPMLSNVQITPSLGLVESNGALYFDANDGITGQELWKSDGTTAGTVKVIDLTSPGSSSAAPLFTLGNRLFFSSNGQLYETDGTAAGTFRVSTSPPLSNSSPGYVVSNGAVYFSGSNVNLGAEPAIVRTSGTVASLFYNGSKYDGNDPAPNTADDAAVAIDKVPYLVGSGPATFSNVSSYTKGINGVMIDLSADDGQISADDFDFKVGNNNSPGQWTAAPAPLSVTVRNTASEPGAHRVEFVWADNAIENEWLQITVAANAHTGLSTPQTFYFGSAIADSGLGDTTAATTDSTDEVGARNHPAALPLHIPISNLYDFNRDGKVDSTDQLAARNNPTANATALQFLNLEDGAEANAIAEPLALAETLQALASGLTTASGSSQAAATASETTLAAALTADDLFEQAGDFADLEARQQAWQWKDI